MSVSEATVILGGLGLFLLGIHHLTEGLKGFAGNALRDALQTVVRGRFSAVVFGAVFTALIQSSSATVLTVIGFVSAGLVTFSQAIGVLVGATFGTSTTPWLVAFFGFRVQIAAFAMPLVGVGAFLWLMAQGRLRALGAVLAGFGLIFIGLDYLQSGMGNISWNIDAFVGEGWTAYLLLAGLGTIMTIVMQSSSAAAAATLVALHLGSVDFYQACAMIVGQSVGTAATSAALGAMSGGLAVRRAALAHIIYSLVVGVLGMILLKPLADGSTWAVSGLDDDDSLFALAAFSSLFKLMGVVVFFPWLGKFAHFIEKISGQGSDTAVARLQPSLANAGGAVALEAAWRATLEVARSAIEVVSRRLAGQSASYQRADEAVDQINHFLESLSLETLDLGAIEPRLVRLCHAVDHLKSLDDDLAEGSAKMIVPEMPDSLGAGARALSAWLDATKTPSTPIADDIFSAVEQASVQLEADRKFGRKEILASVALQKLSTAAAAEKMEALLSADRALHHSWRLVESLRAADED